MKRLFAGIALAALAAGCNTVVISSPGTLRGIDVNGAEGRADRVLSISNEGYFLFHCLPIATGSTDWIPAEKRISGGVELFENHMTGDRMTDAMFRYAASPNSDWIGTCPAAWKCGNILIQYVSIKEAQDKNQKLIDFAETDDVLTNAFFGFNFNTTTVTAERASVSAAQTGLTRSLLGGGYGKAGWAAKADELTKKSYDAGMQVIMDEYIKQYNEWKASK